MSLSFSQACENNKRPILQILHSVFHDCKNILEIGSGTGQHAVFFAEQMPWLLWQTSDQVEHLAGITARCNQAQLDNLPKPFELDVTQQPWPAIKYIDGIFSANTSHIMHWTMVEDFIHGAGDTLANGGVFCLYGPFNYHGHYTSDSNAQFDQWLKQRDPLSGIRDQEAVVALAEQSGLFLMADHVMPANNRLLVFIKHTE